MQKATPAAQGLKITGMFTLLSMGIVMQNPLKYMWITAVLSPAMLYFSIKKYKEEKAIGADTTKSKDAIQMTAVATLIVVIVIIGYNLAEMGFFGDI